jgi:two-component system, OmpR family, copper resistance phosphate regulon response regulator CusR
MNCDSLKIAWHPANRLQTLMSDKRILVAEHDTPLAHRMRKGLETERYSVDVASDGKQARFLAGEYEYDLIILDLNFPRADATDLLRQVQSNRISPPVIGLSERSKPAGHGKIKGLSVDSFLAKPFAFSELSSRIGELLGSRKRAAHGVIRAGDLKLDRASRKVTRAGRRIELTAKEFSLLECLMRHAGQRVSRATIIEQVWKLSPDTMTNVADVYVKSLRNKLDEGFTEKLIQTVRGIGYQLGGKAEESS